MGHTGGYGREQAERGGSAPLTTDLGAQRILDAGCTEVLGLSGPWLDGELDGTRAQRVQAHLAGCPACRLQVAREGALEARIAGSLAAGGRDQGRRWQRALERAVEATPPMAGRPPRRPAFPSAARWIALAASLLLLAALASAGLGLRHRHPWVPPEQRGPGHGGTFAERERAAQDPPGAVGSLPPPLSDQLLPASPSAPDWTVRHDRSPA